MGMMIPVFAGILSALRRVIARRVSLKVMLSDSFYFSSHFLSHVCFLWEQPNFFLLQNQQKKRLHAITITSATCFLFPVAMWDLIIVSIATLLQWEGLMYQRWCFLNQPRPVWFTIITKFHFRGHLLGKHPSCYFLRGLSLAPLFSELS